MTDTDSPQRRERLIKYWDEQRRSLPLAMKRIWERRLDKDRILRQPTCLVTGEMTLVDAIELILIDEETQARTFLDRARAYLEAAIERDDVGPHGGGSQPDLARSSRLRSLVIAQWILGGVLDSDRFRESCALEEGPYREVLSLGDSVYARRDLAQWMLHLLVANEASAAAALYQQYIGPVRKERSQSDLPPEDRLAEVAIAVMRPNDVPARRRAELSLDEFYGELTTWDAPPASPPVLLDEKLLYAYVRGSYFKSVTDPVRLIKMMKLGD